MIVQKINEKQILTIIKKYCLFFPIIVLFFTFNGFIIGKIYISNLNIKEEKTESLEIQAVTNISDIDSVVKYIKNGIETMSKIKVFEKNRSRLKEMMDNISKDDINNIASLNQEIEKLNEILLTTSREKKLIIKNKFIQGEQRIFIMHTYKKDNYQSIIKSIIILSNIFGNFILIWILFVVYGRKNKWKK